MKIDIHTHILPEKLPDWTARFQTSGFVRLDHHAPCRARMMIGDKLFREIDDRTWSPSRRLADCERDGVAVQALSTVPVLFSYWTKPRDGLEIARFLNDHLASVVAEHPRRFVGLGTLPLQDPELAAAELERCVTPATRGGLGLAGVQIGSHINDWNLDAAELGSFFAAAERVGAAVFVHPWEMAGRERMPKYWLPWLVGMPAETSLAICSLIFSGTLERHPRLRIAFAHGGGAFPGSIGRIEHGHRVRPDLCAVDNAKSPREYLARTNEAGQRVPARFWVDSLVHDEDQLRILLKLFGRERVALGSDYPFPLGEHVPGSLIESLADLDAETRRWLLADAAREFLNLNSED